MKVYPCGSGYSLGIDVRVVPMVGIGSLRFVHVAISAATTAL